MEDTEIVESIEGLEDTKGLEGAEDTEGTEGTEDMEDMEDVKREGFGGLAQSPQMSATVNTLTSVAKQTDTSSGSER